MSHRFSWCGETPCRVQAVTMMSLHGFLTKEILSNKYGVSHKSKDLFETEDLYFLDVSQKCPVYSNWPRPQIEFNTSDEIH